MSDALWLDAVRASLERYDEALLRSVATRLVKSRNQWPAEELVERSLATLQNPAVVDRRLKDVPAETRRVLAVVRQSGQMRWAVGNLCEIGAMLGGGIGHEAIVALIEAGLAFPDVATISRGKIKSLSVWLVQSPAPTVIVPPSVTSRLESETLGLAEALDPVVPAGAPLESDGLDWLLRLAILRQIVNGSPLRRTQSRDFFKRDLDRLRADALLSSPPDGAVGEIADPDLFAVALALGLGLLVDKEGEVGLGELPTSWTGGLAAALGEVWAALHRIVDWNPALGWSIAERPGQPFASSNLFSLVLLGELAPDKWARPDDVQKFVVERHPFWVGEKKEPSKTGVTRFLLGVAASLRLVQVAKMDDEFAVRLSPFGRSLLGLAGPVTTATFQQTLLVQPNLEILAYRQGLTPELIARLGNFATWKSLGAACTLQLEPASVYHALEHGESLETIVRILDHHGMKATPTPVMDALKTWANKRDRITVYPSAALFEFASAADLNEALSRGLPAVKVTDRLAVVPREGDIDYKHFRLTGTRDFLLPPEKCVEVESDGVTLVVDLARSDLLLDTEVMRFAEPHARAAPFGKKLYRITPATAQAAKQQGVTLANLESWFEQRTGLPASPAARFLYGAKETPPLEMRRQIVLHVAGAETADGLLQWPETSGLVHSRLGPTTLVVQENDVEPLTNVLKELGIAVRYEMT